MNREEALDIVEQIVLRWPVGEWSAEQMETYTRSIQTLPYELTCRALDAAVKETRYRPSVAELYEFVRAERRSTPQQSAEEEEPKAASGIPFWVRQWVAARFLYEQFGRAQDMRPFADQLDYVNPDGPRMPPDAWKTEGDSISDVAVWAAIGADARR